MGCRAAMSGDGQVVARRLTAAPTARDDRGSR